MRADDRVEQLLGVRSSADVDRRGRRLAEPIEAALGDLFGDQDARHDRHAYRPAALRPKRLNDTSSKRQRDTVPGDA